MIELLVVIAIIGILAALIIPAIGGMYEKGRIVQCVNNLKQLHTAAVNYASAHNGNLPFPASEDWLSIGDNGDFAQGHHTGWVDYYSKSDRKTYWWNHMGTNGIKCIHNGTLFSYAGNKGDESLYVCPSMRKLARKIYSSNDEHSSVIRSYGMNASLQKGINSSIEYFSIDGPSRIAMFAEQGFSTPEGYKYGLTSDSSSPWNDNKLPNPNPSNAGAYIYREYRNFDGCIDWRGKENNDWDAGNKEWESIGEYHKGRGHVVFCDGHVERVAYKNTKYVCSGNWEAHKPVIPVNTNIRNW